MSFGTRRERVDLRDGVVLARSLPFPLLGAIVEHVLYWDFGRKMRAITTFIRDDVGVSVAYPSKIMQSSL